MILAAAEYIARQGRWVLMAGLVAGFALPDLALAMRGAIAPMIVILLFLAVLRMGPAGARAGLTGVGRAIGMTLVMQLALPLLAVAVAAAFALRDEPLVMGIVLVLAAAPLTGSPNLTLLVGGDPTPALRQLVTSTALLPLTVVLVFALLPAMGGAVQVALAALQLLGLIAVSGGLALWLRARGIVGGGRPAIIVMDAAAAILMGVVVIGLVSPILPALTQTPGRLALTMAAAFALNVPLQVLACRLVRRWSPGAAIATGVAAGNRNAALFLGILPPSAFDTVLLFVSCYQVPMYLTPLLMGRWYRRQALQDD